MIKSDGDLSVFFKKILGLKNLEKSEILGKKKNSKKWEKVALFSPEKTVGFKKWLEKCWKWPFLTVFRKFTQKQRGFFCFFFCIFEKILQGRWFFASQIRSKNRCRPFPVVSKKKNFKKMVTKKKGTGFFVKVTAQNPGIWRIFEMTGQNIACAQICAIWHILPKLRKMGKKG